MRPQPRMHAMYSEYLSGVSADFALKIRRAPISPEQIQERYPDLWQRFSDSIKGMQAVVPYSEHVIAALRTHLGMELPEVGPFEGLLQSAR